VNATSDLRNKVAVVTGGNRGIRAAIAQKLASLQATVVICGRKQAELDAVRSTISASGASCESAVCDITNLGSVQNLFEFVRKKFGRVDILVNNAGIGSFSTPLHNLPPENWDQVLNTNLRGVFYTIRTFAPLMIERQSGDIINISSIAGKNALPNGAAYAASKWGLNGLTYSVAEELRQYKIRVSVICPGSVDTDLSPHEGKNKDRMLKPEDVAHVVEMLVTQRPQSFASEVILRPTQKP
jgi:NAD(P)-dependent dehydrogenase (short-subunit alcohol dehydrogenase family)